MKQVISPKPSYLRVLKKNAFFLILFSPLKQVIGKVLHR